MLLSDEDFHLIVGAYFQTHRGRSYGASPGFCVASYKDVAPTEPFFFNRSSGGSEARPAGYSADPFLNSLLAEARHAPRAKAAPPSARRSNVSYFRLLFDR